MKRTFTIVCIAIAAIASFTSCSKDQETAIALSGEWEGDWGEYLIDDLGYKYYADCSYVKFVPSHLYSTHGYGYQEDYYSYDTTGRKRCYYKYMWYRFDWKVDNGVIKITYLDDLDMYSEIRDFKLDSGRGIFDGYFTYTGKRFSMDKMTDWYYDQPAVWVTNGWYGYEVHYIYSNKHEGTAASQKFEEVGSPTIVKRGSRYMEPGEEVAK